MAKENKGGGSAVAEKPAALLKAPPVEVAYPGEHEKVTNPSYTLQIATGEPAASVEVSIDEGDWLPCREAMGLWWYDWSGYDSGAYEAVARLHRADGTTVLSEPRMFEVKFG